MYSSLRLLKAISNEDAQGLVDYALILSLVVILVVGIIALFGESVLVQYENIHEKILGV